LPYANSAPLITDCPWVVVAFDLADCLPEIGLEWRRQSDEEYEVFH
jgi:hypothetical protein